MLLTYAGMAESFVQFVTVLILFCIVLGITYVATRYMAVIQKTRQESGNIAVLETCRVAPNKYIQIVRLGKRYIAVAVCKDTMTKLAELSGEELTPLGEQGSGNTVFAQILEKAKSIKPKK